MVPAQMDPHELTENLARPAVLRKIRRFVALHELEEVLHENVLQVMGINLDDAEHHELRTVLHMIRTASLFHHRPTAPCKAVAETA